MFSQLNACILFLYYLFLLIFGAFFWQKTLKHAIFFPSCFAQTNLDWNVVVVFQGNFLFHKTK
jgi:hypothetical protein